MSQAQPYSVEKLIVDGVEVIRLADAAAGVEVSLAPSLGNNAYDMKVHGKAVLWSPYKTLAAFKQKPAFLGVPFLAPWANRLDGDAYWANGRKYLLNPELNNFRRDQFHQPIHGLVSYASDWRLISSGADAQSAWASSRLEFWRHPDWMAQFPFAHSIQMTHRLSRGALEVRVAVENLSQQPMPLSIGFHPYFAIPDRDEWRLHLAAREHVLLSERLIPTGEVEPVRLPDPMSLRGAHLDDVFTSLVRDANGHAVFWAERGAQRISLSYGTKYPVAVVFAPPGRDFVCFEPMTAITDAFNLAHRTKYSGLQTVPPGGAWEESFWIEAAGY
jgi:aldose 1-epimerase